MRGPMVNRIRRGCARVAASDVLSGLVVALLPLLLAIGARRVVTATCEGTGDGR
jgi:hypothetical protein